MSETAADQATIAETVVFLSHFKDLPDPRQAAKVLYKLDELLLLCLLAVLGGAEAITEIVRFGEKKLDLLRRFRPFVHGVPCHDQLGTILATLDAVAFQYCFVAWVAAIAGLSPDAIAIDGKTSRRSGKGKKPERQATSSRHSPRTGGWCWGRSRSPTSRTRLSPSPSFWTCSRSRVPS